MAGSKLIKKRIVSVRNTCKITRTMEMVSTTKSKRLVKRLQKATPYRDKLLQLLATLKNESTNISSPYIRQAKKIRKCALLVVSSNRGLCGGYNANVLREAREYYESYQEKNIPVDIYVIGKKGLAALRFWNIPTKESISDIEDNFEYEQSEKLAEQLMDSFANGVYDRIDVASTVYYSAARQTPKVTSLLPISWEQDDSPEEKSKLRSIYASSTNADADAGSRNIYRFTPKASIIFSEILPLVIKTRFYSLLLEASAAEQIYRRIAMKNATDAASDMLKDLMRSYNRARQAQITQELAEIVAGADAI